MGCQNDHPPLMKDATSITPQVTKSAYFRYFLALQSMREQIDLDENCPLIQNSFP